MTASATVRLLLLSTESHQASVETSPGLQVASIANASKATYELDPMHFNVVVVTVALVMILVVAIAAFVVMWKRRRKKRGAVVIPLGLEVESVSQAATPGGDDADRILSTEILARVGELTRNLQYWNNYRALNFVASHCICFAFGTAILCFAVRQPPTISEARPGMGGAKLTVFQQEAKRTHSPLSNIFMTMKSTTLKAMEEVVQH